MGIWEILLIVACALIVIGVSVAAIVRKVKGKGGCCGECSGNCSCCNACKNKEKDK